MRTTPRCKGVQYTCNAGSHVEYLGTHLNVNVIVCVKVVYTHLVVYSVVQAAAWDGVLVDQAQQSNITAQVCICREEGWGG